jgi:hypothetical protein
MARDSRGHIAMHVPRRLRGASTAIEGATSSAGNAVESVRRRHVQRIRDRSTLETHPKGRRTITRDKIVGRTNARPTKMSEVERVAPAFRARPIARVSLHRTVARADARGVHALETTKASRAQRRKRDGSIPSLLAL